MPTNGAVATSGDVTPSAATSSKHVNGESRVFTRSEKELLRVIGQHLTSMGLRHTADALTTESGCVVEHSFASNFRSHILIGNWDAALHDIDSIKEHLKHNNDLMIMQSLVLEQKYLELLEKGNKVEALKCLRTQLSAIAIGDQRIHDLSSFAMYSDADALHQKAGWPGVAGGSRELLLTKIHGFLPSEVMLPPNRLSVLLQQALDHQVDNCRFHNSASAQSVSDPNMSFFTDHLCTTENFPSMCSQVLRSHTDEVWYCTWSHDGKILASCSKDGSVILWELDPDTMQLSKMKSLLGHRRGASYCSFSPDGRYLVVCGATEPEEARLWSIPGGETVAQLKHNDDSYTTCAWFADSSKFVVASMRGHFAMCNTHGAVTRTWDGVRVQSVAIPSSSNKFVLAADSLKRVRRYDFDAERAYEVVSEDYNIMSMTLSKDERYALINCANQGIHVWDIEDRCQVRRYRGLLQSNYTIYSVFGGRNEDYIASGSEDSKVYIWHRSCSTPLRVLSGHTRGVNSVAWNPCYPSVLVSASDDETLRVWCPTEVGNGADDTDSISAGNDRSIPAVDRLFSVEEVEGPLEDD
ncbi:WD repeat-containing protein 26-like [Sycon ciliatum]|uniref:WD repeat-containing protein 26-like n=1 Tax=Sycon ciliatum TaxID=27933 RepID=UPI0020AD0231